MLVDDSSFGGHGTGSRVSPGKSHLDRPDTIDSSSVFVSPAAAKGKTRVQPKKRPRQPTPAQTLANPDAQWRKIEVAWYDGETKSFDAVSQTALRHHDSIDPVLIRWVVLRDPAGKLKPLVLGCTDEAAGPEHIVNRYNILRWNIQVTFQEARHSIWVSRRSGNGPGE